MALEVHTQLLITENKYYNEFRFQVRFDFDPHRQYLKASFYCKYTQHTETDGTMND